MDVASRQVVSKEERQRTTVWNLSDYINEDQITLGVGVLGMPGSTAYGGVTDILRYYNIAS